MLRKNALRGRAGKIAAEVGGLAAAPQRVVPLVGKIVADKFRVNFESRHLYSYTKIESDGDEVLDSVIGWMLNAQRPDGGIAAYYSLLTGYSKSYPEVTGYIIPTLYDYAQKSSDGRATLAAERATEWLLSLQRTNGAFPGGLDGSAAEPSIFNTGQILHGLVRAHRESNRAEILRAAIAAGDWLIAMQQRDGSWSGPGAYQNSSHSYYTMVAWALADLAERTSNRQYAECACKNIDWALGQFRPEGWIDGINLQGHPNYLHFIAYVLQGVLEAAIRLRRPDAVEYVVRTAWILLRNFETNKFLPGAYDGNFKSGHKFTCVTGNAQMACVWLRLYESTGDLRYFNGALKMNEMIKRLIATKGYRGIRGGVAGSHPIWGRYQPFRYISWGCKFFADALLLEREFKGRVIGQIEARPVKVLPCAS